MSKKLKTKQGVFPKMYFLPKIHKENTPLRPIVSFVGSPLYNTTKFISNLLKYAFEKDEIYVKNSFELVEQLKNIMLPDNYILVSLDVISPYLSRTYRRI